jgi:hypothetical protein
VVPEQVLATQHSAPLLGFPPPGLPLSRRFQPAGPAKPLGTGPPTTFTAMNPPRLATGVQPTRESVCVESRHLPARGFRPEFPNALRRPVSRPNPLSDPLESPNDKYSLQSACQRFLAVPSLGRLCAALSRMFAVAADKLWASCWPRLASPHPVRSRAVDDSSLDRFNACTPLGRKHERHRGPGRPGGTGCCSGFGCAFEIESQKHKRPGLHPAFAERARKKSSATRADRPASLTPSEVQVLPAVATGGSPRQRLPLVRFGAPRSVICDRVTGPTGSSRSRLEHRRFHRVPRGLSPAAVPGYSRSRFILPRASRPLQSSTACSLPTVPRAIFRPPGSQRAPLLGSCPTSRHQPAAATYRAENPSPRYGPSSAFLPPSTVSSATGLASLFHPAAASWVYPPGVCSSRRSRARFPAPPALVPLDEPACGCPRRQIHPRLQGLALHQECGGLKQRLSCLLLRAPHGLSSSGFSPSASFSAR